jgi:hypothetical protein
MRPWIAPVAVALLSSAYPLMQVELDHTAPPRLTLQLSQRELFESFQRDENSGVTLTWNWAMPPELDSVPRRELAALGITCSRDGYECSRGRKRRGWVVVGLDTLRSQHAIEFARQELDSIAHLPIPDSVRKLQVQSYISRIDQLVLHTSRLVLVAVGDDPEALAAKWNDGAHLVLAARVNAWRVSWPSDTLPGQEPIYSVYAEALPPALYVPREWAGLVRDSVRYGYGQQLYRVTVGIGGRWLPRVLEIIPDPSPATQADSLRLYGITPG